MLVNVVKIDAEVARRRKSDYFNKWCAPAWQPERACGHP